MENDNWESDCPSLISLIAGIKTYVKATGENVQDEDDPAVGIDPSGNHYKLDRSPRLGWRASGGKKWTLKIGNLYKDIPQELKPLVASAFQTDSGREAFTHMLNCL